MPVRPARAFAGGRLAARALTLACSRIRARWLARLARGVAARTIALAAPIAIGAGMPSAHAVEQRLDAARSEIRFVSTQMGVPVEGRFRRFAARIDFDPRAPSGGHASIDIDLTSVAIPGEDTARELATPGWFDSARQPTARFVSTDIRGLGGERFEVRGRLTIKGIAHDVVVPVTYASTGAASTATGTFTLRRRAFRIGDGEWNDTSLVADEVQVRFRLALLAPEAAR